jgi:alkaline phosphatase D
MLGQQQLPFLLDRLTNSAAKWKLISNQVMFTGYAANAAFKQPKYSDWWLGYPAERQQIMDCLASHAVSGTVFLTGDHHQSFVLALHHEDNLFTYRKPYTEKPLAWEFLTPSITSKNGDRLPPQEISATEAMLQQAQTNPHLVFADIKSHGYYIATIREEALEATYYYTDTLRNRDAKEYRAASFRVNRQNFLLTQDRDSVNR